VYSAVKTLAVWADPLIGCVRIRGQMKGGGAFSRTYLAAGLVGGSARLRQDLPGMICLSL